MIINIKQPQSFSEIGRKDNQEDFLWPSPATVTKDQRVFIMCDGVGGQDSGEVASKTAATAIGEYLTANWPADGFVRKEHFQAALSHAYDALDAVDTGAVRKMATTMTCIVLHRGGVLVAHIGDSRVYQLRPSRANNELGRSCVMYQTEDHSLVNDLLRVGEITAEEAANFPQKNVITRAMQPNQENRSRADIYTSTDVQTGDYFFLCCDGVLEQLSSDKLSQIVADPSMDNDEKIQAIKEVCDGATRDNYTCWLVPIGQVVTEECDAALVAAEAADSVEATADVDDDTVTAVPEPQAQPQVQPECSIPTASMSSSSPAPTTPRRPAPVAPKNHSVNAITVATIIVAILALGGALVAYFLKAKSDDKTPQERIEINEIHVNPAPQETHDEADAPKPSHATRENVSEDAPQQTHPRSEAPRPANEPSAAPAEKKQETGSENSDRNKTKTAESSAPNEKANNGKTNDTSKTESESSTNDKFKK